MYRALSETRRSIDVFMTTAVFFSANVGTRPLRGEIDTRSAEDLRAEFPDLIIAASDTGE